MIFQPLRNKPPGPAAASSEGDSEALATPDYLVKLGMTLQVEHGICRIHGAGEATAFPNIDPDELRRKVNDAAHLAVAHYAGNAARASVAFTPAQIEQVAMRVTLNALYLYNHWRGHYEQHRHHPLTLNIEDFANSAAKDECLSYCQNEYGAGYRLYAAALTGMSAEEFHGYEAARRAYADR